MSFSTPSNSTMDAQERTNPYTELTTTDAKVRFLESLY